jgi:tRNA(fMet)-specific endonuclease VapC
MLKYLLDTNICIYTIRRRPPEIRERFNRLSDQLCISSVTWGELVYGAEHSARPEHNMRVIEGFAARLEVLPFQAGDAAHFGQVRAALYRIGKPIGAYDMMIAGHARARGLILVTNNTREFERVPGLQMENWVDGSERNDNH